MIERVTDKRLIEVLDRHLAGMIENRIHVRKDWWSAAGRTAVPMESGMHFVESQAAAISAALKEAGHETIYAVALEDAGELDRTKLSSDEKDLLELSGRAFMFYIALLPADGSFVILCSPDDYIIVAGQRRFVESACGEDIAAARAAYREWAFDDRLRAIADRYEGGR